MQNHIERAFKQACEEIDFAVEQVGLSEYRAQFGGKHAIWTILFTIQAVRIVCLSQLPFAVPASKRVEILTFLNLVNWHSAVGNFEMNPGEGEIVYRTSLATLQDGITSELVATMLGLNLCTCDRYLPGLAQVIYSDMNPDDAFALCVSQAADQDNGEFEDDNDTDDDFSGLNELLDDLDLDRLPGAADD